MSDRYLVISSDCHAGLRPEAYRDYLDPQYHEAFDQALPIQISSLLGRTHRMITSPTFERRDPTTGRG